MLFIWLNNSIKYVINPNEVLSIDEKSYPIYLENLKTTMKNALIFITKFISLIIGNKFENIDEFKEFLTILISSLLGKSSNLKSKQQKVEKIISLIRVNIKNNN